MKICLIGPTYPFRGGLSHYTTLLYKHLKQRHNIHFLAFKRQYPNWLFPGETDKDNSREPIQEAGVERILDSFNPVTWLQVFLRIKHVRPDLVILPWWVSFWLPQFWTITTLLRIFTRSKILFICHNVIEHESTIFDKLSTKLVLRNGDYFIVHSGEDFENLRKILPGADIKQSFHPTYEVFRAGSVSKEEARKQLDVEGNTILFFGFVRPYKGLRYLLEAFPAIVKQVNAQLLIVGEFWEGEEKYRAHIERSGLKDKVRIVNRYIPNEEVGTYFAAADLVVLPYTSATGSGIVQAAFGCYKPVISTNVGCLPQMIEHGKTGFVIPAEDSHAIAEAVVAFYQEDREEEFVENIIREKEKFSWARMVETIESWKVS